MKSIIVRVQIREEMLQLCHPLHADEACPNDQDGCLLFVESLDGRILLQDVASAALEESLIQMRPGSLRTGCLVNCWEPERLSPLVEDTEVATCGYHAEVKIDHLLLINEHRLDRASSVGAIQLQHLAPDKLAAHAALDHWIKGKSQGVQMLGLHVRTQDTRRILKKLLGIHDGDKI